MSSSEETITVSPVLRSKLALALTAFLVVLLCVLIVLAMGVGAVRTIVVSAETASMEIQFSGDADYWDLGNSTICTPLEQLNRSAARGTSFCDPRRYKEEKANVSLSWRTGDKAALSQSRKGIEVLLKSTANYPSGTIVHPFSENLAELGALSFSGFVTLGEVAASGETKLLFSGNYDIREKPFLLTSTETIKTGEFRSGEKVELFKNARRKIEKIRVYGYVLPPQVGSKGFNVSLVSETGPSRIRVNYFGGNEAIEITPNWIDRSIASPLILALSILLPIVLAVTQLFLTTSKGLNFPSLVSAARFLKTILRR